jgi:acetyl esterase/lipase
MRGRVLVGDRDGALEDAHELAAAATAAGLHCVLTVTPGAVHEMPEPPGEPLAGELAALFD